MSTPPLASSHALHAPHAREAHRDAPRAGLRGGPGAAVTPSLPRRLDSRELLDGGREVEIEHAGAVYRLRRTSLGKLILTK